MEYSEAQLAQDIAKSGKTGPRITPEHIEAQIVNVDYWQPTGTTLTVCALTLVNGFHTVGHSASADPDNFDAEIGRKLARQHARDKIWALEGYLLRQRLFDAEG